MSHDLYLYVECGGEMLRDPEAGGSEQWYVERVPFVFALLTGCAGYKAPDLPAALRSPRGMPRDWSRSAFRANPGMHLYELGAHERACLTWYTLAELQTARGRHPYLDALLDRIERATPDPEQTRVIAWVD